MDFFTLVIIMAIVYLLPELLKRRKPKDYKYPEIPSQNDPGIPPLPTMQVGEQVKNKQESTPTVTVASAANAYTVISDTNTKNPWQENLNESMVVNGFVFAEILSPPLAKRPKRNLCNGRDFKNLK